MVKSYIKKLIKKAYPEKTLSYPHVDLFHWRSPDGRTNFGDQLSLVIVRQMLSSRGFTLDDQTPTQRQMLAIGSILHFASSGATIWGSGINGKVSPERFQAVNLDVRAVRGPKTAQFLTNKGIRTPTVFGDPGLLVPHLFPDRFKPAPETDYVVVPNLHDLKNVDPSLPIVSPTQGWNTVIDQILRARYVVASSLHGLVIAEAYGIPAQYVRFTETESPFKYLDYYLGTGRKESDFKPATSVKEALDTGGMPPLQRDIKPLLDAFPWDLWETTSNRV